EFFALPADGIYAELDDTGLRLSRIESLMDESKAGNRLLLVDACRSNPFVGTRGGPTTMAAEFMEALGKAPGQALLMSCDNGQSSLEDPALGHGIFTYYLLAALKGRAPPDPKGLVRVNSVVDFVQKGM